MKTDHISDQDICLYVDALKLHKTEHLPQGIVTHVSDCVECKKQVMQLYDVLKAEDYKDVRDHPTFGPRERSGKEPAGLIFRLAAGVVILLAVGVIAYFALIKHSHEPGAPARAAATDSIDVNRKGNGEGPTSAAGFAANFIPSPNMEDLVGADFRAASVTVNSPMNGEAVKGDIVFRWESRSPITFRVRVLTNKETEAFQATTNRNSVLCDKQLEPGLYYWTLQEDGELVHVGKFTVPVR